MLMVQETADESARQITSSKIVPFSLNRLRSARTASSVSVSPYEPTVPSGSGWPELSSCLVYLGRDLRLNVGRWHYQLDLAIISPAPLAARYGCAFRTNNGDRVGKVYEYDMQWGLASLLPASHGFFGFTEAASVMLGRGESQRRSSSPTSPPHSWASRWPGPTLASSNAISGAGQERPPSGGARRPDRYLLRGWGVDR